MELDDQQIKLFRLFVHDPKKYGINMKSFDDFFEVVDNPSPVEDLYQAYTKRFTLGLPQTLFESLLKESYLGLRDVENNTYFLKAKDYSKEKMSNHTPQNPETFTFYEFLCFSEWLKVAAKQLIVLVECEIGSTLVWINSEGEVLHSSNQLEISTGNFLNKSDLAEGKCLSIWSNTNPQVKSVQDHFSF